MAESKADQLRAMRERNYNSPGKRPTDQQPVKMETLKKLADKNQAKKASKATGKKRGPYKKKAKPKTK